MFKFMYSNIGTVLDVRLPRNGRTYYYAVMCRYIYDKDKEKYRLSMWLRRSDLGDMGMVQCQDIDTQYVSSDRETIKSDIVKIVENAYESGYFDYYMKSYEYSCKCFERGNEYYEKERMETDEGENENENGQVA